MKSRALLILVPAVGVLLLLAADLVLQAPGEQTLGIQLDAAGKPEGPSVSGKDPGQAPLPTLEELQKVRWVKQPCVRFLDHLRETLASEPRLATEAEALALKNDGEDANRKILSALGRLPESDDEVDWDATLRRWTGSDPSTLNPIFFSTRYEQWLDELLFHVQPIQFDWKFDHYGDLDVIVSWETSEDHLMDRVVLRDDLTWSDGKPLTAQDIEFSWQVIVDPRVRIPAHRHLASGLRAVKAYDARTVVYFQKEALATNHLHLSWPTIPRHVYQESRQEDPSLEKSPYHAQVGRKPVTSGPYKLVSWEPNQEIVLERRDEWYLGANGARIRPKPFLKQVRLLVLPDNTGSFLAMQSGRLDDVLLDSDRWVQAASDAKFSQLNLQVRGEQWSYAYIGWNSASLPSNPFFGDKRVRLAMTLALDHDYMLKELFYGIYRGGQGIFHPDSWMAARDLKTYRRDLDGAERLLAEAGWKDTDADGILDKEIDGKRIPFEFVLTCPKAGSGKKVAELLEPNLQKVGVRCILEEPETAAFWQGMRERRYAAFLMAMGTGTDPDTNTNLWSTAAIKDGRNYPGISIPRVDELFAKGRREFDRAKRAAIYAEIDRLIAAEHPITNLLYTPTLWGFSRSVRGYRHSPRGFYNFMPGPHSIWKKKAP